jgi:putative transposase
VSFWRLYYHLVWATEKRPHLITPRFEERLNAYLTRKAAEFEVRV